MLTLFQRSFKAMGSPCEIQVYAESLAPAELAMLSAIEKISSIESKFSRYREDSVVSKINRAAGHSATEVDDETADLLDFAMEFNAYSGGMFDLTSGVLRRIWNFSEAKIPSQSEIDALLPLIGSDKIDWKKPYLKLSKEGMEIDFGGIAKEYAVDLAVGALSRYGIQNALVNLGGDIRVIAGHPDGAPWSIGIAHPRKPGEVVASLTIAEGAVATSGDYERFFEKDGVRYCHILNATTGYPVNSFQSVTVFAESCLAAGSLSTLAMLLGEEAGRELLSSGALNYFGVLSSGESFRSD